MSRRNPSPADMLIMLPWQVSATLGIVAFVCLRWVVPNLEFESSVFATYITKATRGLSWFAFLGFGILAGASALFAAKKRSLLDTRRDLESLRALSWQQFEWLVGEAYRRQGYSVEESLAGGPDGGIDLILRKDGQTSLVQCKRWKTQSVGAPVIREMFGLLAHHRANRVIVVTSGGFTREASAFADGKPIELVDGSALLALVQSVQRLSEEHPVASPAIVPTATAPVSVTPALSTSANEVKCPTCGAPMLRRTAKRGSNVGNEFWGCSNYPTCRGVRNI